MDETDSFQCLYNFCAFNPTNLVKHSPFCMSGILAPTVSVPVTNNGDAASVRSPLAGVGEALNPNKFPSSQNHEDDDRRGGFSLGKDPNQFSHQGPDSIV